MGWHGDMYSNLIGVFVSMFIEDFLDLDVLDEICNTMILTLIYYIVPLVVIFLFKVSLK